MAVYGSCSSSLQGINVSCTSMEELKYNGVSKAAASDEKGC